MDPNDRVLLAFSYSFILVMGLLLVVPVLRRQRDVFCAWNLYLLGTIVFGGLSGINCVTIDHYLPNYKSADYNKFYLGVAVFYPTIIATYHFFRWPRKLAGKSLLKWPELNASTVPLIALPLAAVVVAQVMPIPIPGVHQFLSQAALSAPVLALACAFIVWSRSPSNVFMLLLVLIVFGAAVFGATSSGTSRRYLVGVLATAPVCLYWTWLRYKPTPYILGTLLAAAAIAFPVMMGYTMIRHLIKQNVESSSQRFSNLLNELPKAVQSGGSSEGLMGQDSVEAAIMCIHLLNNGSGALEVDHFFTPKWVLSNPIPRAIWPDKPRSTGIELVHASGLASRGMNFNIGLNVIGQAYHDGGVWMHFLYAFLFGSFLRFVDELLVRQPGNPYLIGALVAMSGQLIAWTRGGIDVMSMQIILVCAITVFVGWAGKIVLGVGLHYPRTDHLVDYPVLRSPADRDRWLRSIGGAVPSFTRGQAPAG
ncbi:hypothetical protein MalM25_01170 [Planctomycetes bacterium MalM25]|nr:hypothetical protein MalM25_01170 [Planctomycetes bacterium MalM25]